MPKRASEEQHGELVSASALAVHLACTRQYVAKLTSEGVIERQGEGYDQDRCRWRYLAHLRSENRRSPRAAADAAHTQAKTELMNIRIMEKQRQLVRREDVNELIDTMAGVMLTHLSSLGARCTRDLVVRRNIDAVVLQIRRELSQACSKIGEPPLEQQLG
jgi:hypothetical protein